MNPEEKHENPFVPEVCQDLLMDDPNQMHNIDIKNAYMALLTNKEFKIAMCEREEEIGNKPLKKAGNKNGNGLSAITSKQANPRRKSATRSASPARN